MSNMKISIIVPVYNGAKWIESCLKRIFAQSFRDWELIVVNDGSTDETLSLLKVFQNEGFDFKIINKANGGVSSARNVGIEQAKGEYIAFIDVDDFIESTYLENLSNGFGFDMVVTGFCYDVYPQPVPINMGQCFKTKDEVGRCLNYYLNTDHFCFPWARLFKTAIINENNIRFDTRMRFGEDHVFNWTYLQHISSLYIDSATDYRKMPDVNKTGYNLSYDEMEYVDRCLYLQQECLEHSFKLQLHPSAKTFCHVLFMKNYLTANPCSFYAQYYRRFHTKADEREVYDYIAQNIYHPGLKNVKHGIYSIGQLNAFLDEPWKLMKYTKIKSKYLIPIIIFVMKISASFQKIMTALINRYKRYYVYPMARRKFNDINILNSFDSIQYIIDNRCSLSRFGDGEFDLMRGESIPFQKSSEKLTNSLKLLFFANDDITFKVGIPYTLKDVSGTLTFACDFWGKYVKEHGVELKKHFNSDRVYLDTQISRFYKDWVDYNRSTRHLQMLKKIWDGMDIVIVEGNLSRTGIGNDLYANAKKIERILGYATDAFFHYDEMLNAIQKSVKPEEGKLILLSYGPTATVLAYDLAKLGYWAIDLGHLDIEYEWYLRKERWAKIERKFVNESHDGGNVVAECNDEEYLNQIICDITKD